MKSKIRCYQEMLAMAPNCWPTSDRKEDATVTVSACLCVHHPKKVCIALLHAKIFRGIQGETDIPPYFLVWHERPDLEVCEHVANNGHCNLCRRYYESQRPMMMALMPCSKLEEVFVQEHHSDSYPCFCGGGVRFNNDIIL